MSNGNDNWGAGWDSGTVAASEEPGSEFVMDADGVGPDDLGRAGDVVDCEGFYHFEISDVVFELDKPDKTPAVRFDLTVLQSVPGQSPEGSIHFHRIYVGGKNGAPASDGSKKNAVRWFSGLGMLREVERNGQKVFVNRQGTTKMPPEMFRACKGMQCCAKVKKEEEAGYDARYQIPFSRVHQVDSPAAGNCVKNKDALALIGKADAAQAASGSKATTKTGPANPPSGNTSTAAQTAAPAGGSPLNDPTL